MFPFFPKKWTFFFPIFSPIFSHGNMFPKFFHFWGIIISYRCICEMEPDMSENFACSDFTFFKLKLISTVPNQFNGSISMSAMNLGENWPRGQIFWHYHVTRPKRAKIRHFQNLFRFTQYGCHSFSIDASSDPTKFQDDWPSGSTLIGAWSSDFAFNVFVSQVEPRVRSDFFGRKSIS